MSKGFKISIGILGLFIVAIILMVISSVNESQKTRPGSKAVQTKVAPLDILKYRVVKKQDYSYLNTPRIAYRIILDVEKLPLKKRMEKTAIHIWQNGNKSWKEFTVFMYLPDMDTQSAAYYVAEFRPNGLIKSEVQGFALLGTRWEQKEEVGVKEAKEQLKEQAPEAKEYFINLDVKKTHPRKIRISVITNFPDGTNFLVNVDRIYYEKGKSEKYSGEIISKDLPVENGKIELDVFVNDSVWYNKYYQDAKQFGGLIDYPGIGRISPDITVAVLFSPRRKQRKDILNVLGTDGEFVSGSGVERSMAFTVYTVSKLVDIPFQK